VLDFPHFTFQSFAEQRAQKRVETHQIASSASRQPGANPSDARPGVAPYPSFLRSG
jgi:hypothetical protein